MRAPLLALLLAPMLAACGQAPGVPARPPLWRVSDGDTVIWLLGSLHLVPAGVAWRTPAVERAIGSAGELVLEIPADETGNTSAFRAFGEADGLPPLAERVPARARARLAAMLRRIGAAPDGLDRDRSWAAAVALSSGDALATGATVTDGVEAVLARRFADTGKPVAAIETLRDQVSAYAGLPEPVQRQLIADALDGRQGYRATLAAWSAGDAARLAALVAATPAGARAALVDDRNARFAAWLRRRLARPGVVLAALGAGHLVGPGSVVERLRGMGVRVERIE